MPRHLLSDLVVRRAKPREKPYRMNGESVTSRPPVASPYLRRYLQALRTRAHKRDRPRTMTHIDSKGKKAGWTAFARGSWRRGSPANGLTVVLWPFCVVSHLRPSRGRTSPVYPLPAMVGAAASKLRQAAQIHRP